MQSGILQDLQVFISDIKSILVAVVDSETAEIPQCSLKDYEMYPLFAHCFSRVIVCQSKLEMSLPSINDLGPLSLWLLNVIGH